MTVDQQTTLPEPPKPADDLEAKFNQWRAAKLFVVGEKPQPKAFLLRLAARAFMRVLSPLSNLSCRLGRLYEVHMQAELAEIFKNCAGEPIPERWPVRTLRKVIQLAERPTDSRW